MRVPLPPGAPAGLVVAALGVLALLLLRGPAGPPLAVSTSGTVVVVRTAADSRVYLAYGPGRRHGLFTAASDVGRTHRFDLAPLAPGRYDVEAVAREGARTLTARDVVVTAPPGPAAHVLRVSGDHLELDGRPWIPRFAWGSCASDYAAEAAVGIDAFMSSNCGDSPARQAQAAARVGAVVVPAVDAPRAPVTTGNAGVDVLGTARNGALAVFAVNPSPTDSVAEVFTVPGLAGRGVEVWTDGRTLRASGDSFADTLPPLAWRVYLVAPL